MAPRYALTRGRTAVYTRRLMANLKNLTVRYLRELARKHLGDGHSRLKTRDDLLSALRRVVPGLLPEERQAAVEAKTPPAEVIRFHERTRPRAAPIANDEAAEPGGERVTGITQRKEAPAVELSAKAPPAEGPRPVQAMAAALNEWPPAVEAQWAEPVVEGFFVARIAGESEVRRHHLTAVDSPNPSSDAPREPLPRVPQRYEVDRLVLLARDPVTLFTFWDLTPKTRGERHQVQLRLYDNGHEVRRVEVPLDAPSWYHCELQPGRRYRAELWERLEDGTERSLGLVSNEVTLPHDDLSADTRVRFMRVSPDVPLNRREESAAAPSDAGEPRPRGISLEVLRERWEPGANSGSWQLRSWRERVDIDEGMPLPSGAPSELFSRAFPIGGSSSFTLTSSFGLGGGSGSGRGGKS